MPFLKETLLTTLLLFLFFYSTYSQNCACNGKTEIKICYFSSDDVCGEGNNKPECSYTLDGKFMSEGLTKKLKNKALFNSTTNCALSLNKVNINLDLEAINEEECNVFFIGNFYETNGSSNNLSKSILPKNTLQAIKEWSFECKSNIVIATQAEAKPWGYITKDKNKNPNTPTNLGFSNPIFDGPFGTVSQFLQGGSYQGIFTDFPTTGYDILAKDKNNNPTIVHDTKSNSIFLSDIGIFCNLAGKVSEGPNIKNNNDILVANIFSLSCSFTNIFSRTNITLCRGEGYLLPSGILIHQAGIYLDTFNTALGCDSIIISVIETPMDSENHLLHEGCKNDGFSIEINNTVYNQNNPNGIEVIPNFAGCDSTITIDFIFHETDSSYQSFEICNDDSLVFNGIIFYPNTSFKFHQLNQNNCDSIGLVDIIGLESYIINESIQFCDITNSILPNGVPISESGIYYDSLTTYEGCDSIFIFEVTISNSSQFDIIHEGCQNDGTFYKINSVIYDENNPNGQEIISNSNGCDSFININLIYHKPDSNFQSIQICSDDTYSFEGKEYLVGTSETFFYTNQFNCDSIITLDIQSFNSVLPQLRTEVEIDHQKGFTFNIPLPNDASIHWLHNEGLSCYDCPNPTIINNIYHDVYSFSIIDKNLCETIYFIKAIQRCSPIVPNVFSPNADGINDYLTISSTCKLDKFNLQVFNRWGGKLFETETIGDSWDGKINGEDPVPGVYVYAIEYEINNKKEIKKGSVTIVR